MACEDADGRVFIVEMQRIWRCWLDNMLVYYTCRRVDEEGRKYEAMRREDTPPWDYDMRPVCTICLMNNEDSALKEDFVKRDIVLYDRENGEVFSETMRIVIVNMPQIEWKTISVDIEYYENLLVLMRQISENMLTAKQLIEQINSLPFSEEEKKIFRRVVSVSETAKMTLQEYRRYEAERMFYLDSMAFYYCERAEGRTEGRKVGHAEGLAEGIEQGTEKGIKTMVEAMRAQGFSQEQIDALLSTVQKS